MSATGSSDASSKQPVQKVYWTPGIHMLEWLLHAGSLARHVSVHPEPSARKKLAVPWSEMLHTLSDTRVTLSDRDVFITWLYGWCTLEWQDNAQAQRWKLDVVTQNILQGAHQHMEAPGNVLARSNSWYILFDWSTCLFLLLFHMNCVSPYVTVTCNRAGDLPDARTNDIPRENEDLSVHKRNND